MVKKDLNLPYFLAVSLLLMFGGFYIAEAVIDNDPACLGNVCFATVNIGGEDVDYSYTLNHNDSSSTLKFRFTAPAPSSSSDPIRFQVTVSKSFSSTSVLKNPSPLKFLPPDETINLTQTQIERSDSSPTEEVDFVINMNYVAPTPGAITVSLLIARNADSVIIGPFDVQIDASSPSNLDEGQSLDAIYGAGYLECSDARDNDFDYRLDCADANCTGEPIGGASFCESVESTCNDGFDNDGDGLIDCADPQCNGLAGTTTLPTKFCGFENGGTSNFNCADGFDNDGNGKVDCQDDAPATGCWKTGFQDCAKAENTVALCSDNIDNDRDSDYSEDMDSSPATGIDCRDFDCAGIGPTCTTSERLRYDSGSGTFIDDPSQCFNGLDDDLDGDIDCSDVDCLGATAGPLECAGLEAYLPPSPLGDGDPLPAIYFNFCGDGLDNDGDGDIDGADTDCQLNPTSGRFGECGPVPTTENISFASCSDSLDNDLNTFPDCSDSVCRTNLKHGRIGCKDANCGGAGLNYQNTDAALCGSENTESLCGDGLDNDADGFIDCLDFGCTGLNSGPPTLGGFLCLAAEAGAGACHDGEDNDGDGAIDCYDSGCQDGIECAERPAAGWTVAPACVTVPNHTTPVFILGDGNLAISHDDRLYVNSPYEMRITSPGPINSFTLVIGDAIDPTNAFPIDADESNCSISGPSASQLRYSSTDSDVGAIFQREGEVIANLDVTLNCTISSSVPVGPPPSTFTVAAVIDRGGVISFGETTFSLQIYENTPPVVTDIEIEGIVAGTLNIQPGGTLKYQGIPNNDPSGICGCESVIESGSLFMSSADGNCLFDSQLLGSKQFFNDVSAYQIDMSITDGASNVSATTTALVDINVLPGVSENYVLGVDTNGATVYTYRGSEDINVVGAFQTDTLSNFDATTCDVWIFDKSWVGATQASSVVPTSVGNEVDCQGTYTVNPAMPAGQYWLVVKATDSSGDIVRSNAQSFLKCETSDIGIGDCKDADFDNDGTPEGRYTPSSFTSPPTPTYPGAPDPPPGHACDNCVNFYNPSQTDENANGIGDSCETGAIGRCQYKTCSGSGTPCTTDDQCSDPDRCIVVDQGMCTINCTNDSECQPPSAEFAGVCNVDWGLCTGSPADEGNCCFSNNDCVVECEALVQPFIETSSGQIYSGGSIQSSEEPPIHNATYCLQANNEITNFTSQFGCSLPQDRGYEIPKSSKNYLGSFGVLDINGILGGKYGPLLSVGSIPASLNGGIYHFNTNQSISNSITFLNSSGPIKANGLIIIEGANLIIDADLTYQDKNESNPKNLASVGWIVLNNGGIGGNIIIDGDVNNLVGAFYAEGNISTGNSDTQLRANGMFVAESFDFERQYSSRTGGSEKIDFDARVILNPPPGMTDITRSLPGFQSIPGQ